MYNYSAGHSYAAQCRGRAGPGRVSRRIAPTTVYPAIVSGFECISVSRRVLTKSIYSILQIATEQGVRS